MKNENLVPKVRFKGFSDPWEQRKLFEVTERVTRKNTQLQSTLPLTISAQYGLIDQNTFFDKQVASRDVSGYYLIKNGEFAYNKSYSKGYPVGTIKRLDKYSEGVLSTLYILFKVTNADSQFLVTYFEGNKWYQEVMKRATEGARNHGLLNISPKDFFNMHLFIPVKSEQYKVGSIILKISCLIAANEDKLEQLKTLKKLMMQKIFSQEWRFKGFTDPWEQRKLGDYGNIAMNRRIFKEETSTEGDIPFYKIGTFGKNPDAFISQKRFIEYKSKYPYPKKGDILISASGSIGRTIEYQGENAYYQDSNIVWLNHDERLVNSFLKQFYLIVRWSGLEGSTIKRLYNKNILKTNICVPLVDEQNKIGNFLSKLDSLIAANEDKLNQLKKLKKYLMQNMFV
ncbi:restriction endonuclease subunit S [Lactiplantibacillus plantarum]|uniref:restriction endonuclease subunit S n=1 Tax=Lactiplantibacillus plantarum TaxID=1590 RepID=UPI001075EB45|nr:restriction endonuclease subunit S [Lactiplantibacillus plantarum]TFZ25996.1 restriction endonuclease subunit S [Lactiplantibacillus plantarum]